MALYILVNIGWGNGLVPDGTKPLPQPMLPNHKVDPPGIHFHQNLIKFQVFSFMKMHFKILSANCQALFPELNMLKQSIAVSFGCLLDWLKEKWYIFASYLLILLCLNKQDMFSNPFRLQWLIRFSGTWSLSLVHLMACCLMRTKPLSEPNLLIINQIFIKIQEWWLNFPEGISFTFC